MTTPEYDFKKETMELLHAIHNILTVHQTVWTGLENCAPIVEQMLRKIFQEGIDIAECDR